MKYLPATVLLVFLLSASNIHAQEIKLHFPHFASYAYEWNIFQGKNPVTVRSGEIPPDGPINPDHA